MRGRWRQFNLPLVAAGAVFVLFVADILIAKLQLLAGNSTPLHVGEVGQFLLLLITVILFVIGTLREERRSEQATGPGKKSREPAE